MADLIPIKVSALPSNSDLDNGSVITSKGDVLYKTEISKFRGESGVDGQDGQDGQDGADGSGAKIETWTAKAFNSGNQVFHEGKIYESNADTVAGDVPGASGKWVEKIGGSSDPVEDELLPNNFIVGEGTDSPTVITIKDGNGLVQESIDNNSPIFPDQYLNMRRFTTLKSSGSSFIDYDIPMPSPKPESFSFRYWVRDADIENVYSLGSKVKISFIFGGALIDMIYEPLDIISSVGNEVLDIPFGSITTNNAQGKFMYKCIDKRDGWSCVSFTWYDITYKAGYDSPTFRFYIYQGSSGLFGKKIDTIGFTWLFNDEVTSSNVYPDAGGKKQYPQSLSGVLNQIESLGDRLKNIEVYSIKVIKYGANIYARSKFDENRDLVQTFTIKNIIGYGSVFLIDNNKDDSLDSWITGTLERLQSGSDDVAPIRYNNTYIGGGHGTSDNLKVTMTAHGKTNVDIGSEWIDGDGKKFYITRIIDANNLWVLSENLSSTDIWQFKTSISGNTLTHSLNATNTSSINFSSYSSAQFMPSVKKVKQEFVLDGIKKIIEDGLYECNYLDIVDSNDIIDTASVLEILKNNVGTNYTNESLDSAYLSGDVTVSNKILYRVQSNGSLQIIYGFRNYKEINLDYAGFMQATAPNTTYPKLKLYMPKVKPYVDGAKTWDFRNIENYDTGTSQFQITESYWEDILSPPERAIEFLCDASGIKKVGFSMGYDLTKGVGAIREDLVNSAWYLLPSRKMYPKAIDSKLNPFTANQWYSMIGYRIFFNAENPNMGGASSLYHYKVGSDTIVIFDYHQQATLDVLKLPLELAGKTVEVVEKSNNVNIHTMEVMQGGVTVSVTAGAYAYCVLKIS